MSDDLVIEACHALMERAMRTETEGERSIYRDQETAIRALLKRRDELLASMVKLTRETPYPEEAGNAGVLMAEVGTLKARVAELEQDRANYAAICSKVNDAIGRAGIHCALDFWEAIDRITAERDELRAAVAQSKATFIPAHLTLDMAKVAKLVAELAAARGERDKASAARVVHCKREKHDVYIGRPSKWGNPFKLEQGDDRAAVIAQYEAWLRTQPHLMAALGELRGKVLGCWCAPKSCHGDVLLRLAEEAADITDPPPPAFPTLHPAPCIGCSTTILPGDDVRHYEEGYVHAHGCPPKAEPS